MSESIRSESAVKSKEDLPPSRDRKALRPVKPPLSNVSFHRFNYYMALAAALILAFYAWRLMAWKAEVGGWWNLALGKKPPFAQNTPVTGGGAESTPSVSVGGEATVEERINQLAVALGMPSKDLASAIASAVHDYVPPATLSSVAAHQTGYVNICIIPLRNEADFSCREAVSYLVDPEGAAQSDAASVAPVAAATKGFKAAVMAFDAAVGMEEPPSEMA